MASVSGSARAVARTVTRTSKLRIAVAEIASFPVLIARSCGLRIHIAARMKAARLGCPCEAAPHAGAPCGGRGRADLRIVLRGAVAGCVVAVGDAYAVVVDRRGETSGRVVGVGHARVAAA